MLVKIEARIPIFQARIFIFQARPCLQARFLGSANSTKIVVRWSFAPDPTGVAYSAPPDPLAGFKGPYS